MVENDKAIGKFVSDPDDSCDIDRELDTLICAEAESLATRPEILNFLARELGEAIDQAQGKPPAPSRRKN